MTTRREFLECMTLATLGTSLSLTSLAEELAAGPVPRRPYGHDGVQLSIFGFGGIVVMNTEQDHANRTVAKAVERGVNYFDVAPTYGNAEERLGPALQPHRKACFLACKTHERTAEGARRDLDTSFHRLKTDHFDLYQLHALNSIEKDLDVVFGKGGAMEPILEAKRAGKIRYLGFSAHNAETALAAMDRHDFDSILFPVSFTTWYQGDFGPQVVKKAQEKGVAILALKALARQRWPDNAGPQRRVFPKCWYQPVTDPAEQELALRWTLSKPVVAAVSPGAERLFWEGLAHAERFRPITEAETQELTTLATTLTPLFHT